MPKPWELLWGSGERLKPLKPEKARTERVRRPPVCEECGIYRADPPSKICVGCEAYREHQR
jgi:hypothetical protein